MAGKSMSKMHQQHDERTLERKASEQSAIINVLSILKVLVWMLIDVCASQIHTRLNCQIKVDVHLWLSSKPCNDRRKHSRHERNLCSLTWSSKRRVKTGCSCWRCFSFARRVDCCLLAYYNHSVNRESLQATTRLLSPSPSSLRFRR